MKIGHLCHRKLGLNWPSSKICSQKFSRFGWRVLSISKCSISASFESCGLRFRRVINTGWNFCILGDSNQNVNFRTLTIIVLHHVSISKYSISVSFASCGLRFRRVINPMCRFCVRNYKKSRWYESPVNLSPQSTLITHQDNQDRALLNQHTKGRFPLQTRRNMSCLN